MLKNYLNEKELRSMGQLVSGYLYFVQCQAEREQVRTMKDWAKHLDNILTISGEQLLNGSGTISKVDKKYKKYKEKTLSDVEKDYLDSIRLPESIQKVD